MKKKIKLLLTTILMMSVMVGCGNEASETTSTTTPTPTIVDETPAQVIIEEDELTSDEAIVFATGDFAYMGLIRFEENADGGNIYENPYNIFVEYSADVIVETLGNNDIDFATLPLSVALDIYNSDEFEYDIQVLAILNTGGYI